MSDTATAPRRDPSLLQALLPLIFLVAGLASSVYLYGSDSSYGANQIALLLAGGVAGIIGIYNGLRWDDIQAAITRGIALATPALLILLAVGALIGTWILSGTVPALIVYGLKLMDPSFFYPAACLICAVVSMAIGSSWTVAGTLGVALMGVASGLDMSPAITAGAVISGAYFGDKLSPLSDTTNLAPAAAGGELFTHVRHMAWTTIPAFVLAMIGFTVVGLGASAGAGSADFGDLAGIMGSHFDLGLHLLIPMAVVFTLALKRFPAYPTILIGALVGAVFAVLFQPDRVVALAGSDELSRPWALLSGAWKALATGYSADTGNEAVNELISRGGMESMLNTVWLILCAMAFGAVMETVGLLERLIRGVLALARSTGSLITATIATAFGCNLVAADQYMAIVLTGRLFKPEYEKRGLAPENLSRALEDGGTLTSPLVPWNTCGAYMAVTLGVSTIDYLPYVFFNLVSPVLAALLAYAGYKISRARGHA
ncbi:MAG: Na+/H+ antiporter NhaC [Lysobacterales bacterium]